MKNDSKRTCLESALNENDNFVNDGAFIVFHTVVPTSLVGRLFHPSSHFNIIYLFERFPCLHLNDIGPNN